MIWIYFYGKRKLIEREYRNYIIPLDQGFTLLLEILGFTYSAKVSDESSIFNDCQIRRVLAECRIKARKLHWNVISLEKIVDNSISFYGGLF